MQANPALPSAENGKKQVVNSGLLPPLMGASQRAEENQANAILMPKWRAALAKMQSAAAGTKNARILCIGDSTTFGVFSNGTSTGDLKPLAWPTQLANRFNSVGINAHANSFFGSATGAAGGTAQSNDQNDSRVSMGTGWSRSVDFGVCGTTYTANNTTSGPFAFTPTVPVDTFTVYFYQQAGGSTLSWNINGGAATNVNLSGTQAIGSFTASGTLGTNTINLNWVSNGAQVIRLMGIEAYDSSKNWVGIINAGWPVARSTDWNSTGFFYAAISNGIAGLKPDLSILDLGINDNGAGNSLNLYIGQMQNIINQCKLSGDVILQSPNPTLNNYLTFHYPYNQQTAMQQALLTLANTNNIPMIDIYGRWGGTNGYAISNANGLMGDNLHPSAAGYADKASAGFKIIGSP